MTSPRLAMMHRRSFLAASAAAVAASGLGVNAAPRPRFMMDGLSFLLEDLAEIRAAGLGGMICDISEIEEVRDKDNVRAILRTFEKCSAALDAAVTRLANRREAFVARRVRTSGRAPAARLAIRN